MRPQRIEVEGFSAFRSRAEVDLSDVDLFALVGPTGAGKSSVIDAMVFALYGAVPRYDDDRLVAPVINQSSVEARVRLDFTVGDVAHTVVRVVRRTKRGATTKEARLERGADVLADDAKGVSAAVTDLLGLTLEQFTKCVVLPQGAFAKLLHDTAGNRQDLLVRLLDLGLYERLAQAAGARQRAAEARLTSLADQLAALGEATEDAVAASAGRVAALVRAVDAVAAADGELARHAEDARAAEEEARRLRDEVDRLVRLAVPDGVADVGAARARAAEALRAAEADEVEATAAVSVAVAAREALGDPAEARAALEAHARAEELADKVARGEAYVADHAERLVPLREAESSAQARLDEAVAVHERVRVAESAADLARHLHPGDSCPVCGGTVSSLPAVDAAALEAAEARVREATTARDAAREAREAHEREGTRQQDRLDVLRGDLVELRGRLDGAAAPEALRARLDAVGGAEADVAAARRAEADARGAVRRARGVLDDAAAAEVSARRRLADARDAVAALGPPPPGGEDLAADWQALVAWGADEAERRRADAAAAAERAHAAAARREDVVASLRSTAASVGVAERGPARIRDAVVAAAASAGTAHERLVADAARAADLRAERATVEEERVVHAELRRLLGARELEQWLLDEALAVLVEGASDWLLRLSSGRYSLDHDEARNFTVVDHTSADERRLARTLSGGETFLASLALALALAERVTDLSATGGARLDAIFLDEGFGTLDPDTLDVVATAIEELGASGRMVGVISHVRELAERVPVRFEVAKGPDTSQVTRVEV